MNQPYFLVIFKEQNTIYQLMKEGDIIILICLILGYFAYYFFLKEKYTVAMGFLLIGAATLKIYLSAHLYFSPWDEKFHALVAKNMILHPFKPTLVERPVLPYDIYNWATSHIWLHKQPMMLWIMGLSIKIFGTHEWAVRLPSLLMSLGTILLTFKITQILMNERIATIAAFCLALAAYPTSLAAGLNATDHIDTAFLFFITLGIYTGMLAVSKNKWWLFTLCGLITGMAILTKWLPGLIVLGVTGIYLLSSQEIKVWRKLLAILMMLVATTCVFLPWQLYIFSAFPEQALYEYNFNTRHIYEVIEGHGGSSWFHVDMIVKFWTFLFYLFIPAFIFYTVKDKLKWKGVLVLAWIFIPIVFFSFAKTKMPAFTLFTYPAIAIAIAYAMDALLKIEGKGIFAAKLITRVFIIFLCVQTVDYLKLTIPRKWEQEWCIRVKNLAKVNREKPLVIFNDPSFIEDMYYIKNCTAYHIPIDTNTVDSLKRVGYEVLKYDLDKQIYITQ